MNLKFIIFCGMFLAVWQLMVFIGINLSGNRLAIIFLILIYPY